MSLRVERVVTSGVFSLDGEDFDVDNNVWLVGDDDRVVVIDAAHDADRIAAAVGGRRVLMILATHGHNDHINAAVGLAAKVHAPVALHPDDLALWRSVHPGRAPDLALSDGQTIEFSGHHLHVLHTPGHSPGGVCVHLPGQALLFSGDTLFKGGPGATGRSWSDFPTIVASIRDRLLVLPPATIVHTGHGDDTTIGAEAPHLDEWIARGH
ncbi:MBL fold metallo-hydrolase [Acidiferrimicrobium sp. IK]|uniref:MBL fold metallo-hydrolase n=1 Tax=Acidiferrimicrobium sp. IK TaxID=2871700 RepID=UPI0021CB76FD|nr:MBL fold metallo-hydrolase [Acidiferrimicrobium sp. IK]MCU4184374.1 MBL fold metallo-hydrolase [Acidiferrimicrobium sp. IK]